MRLVALRGANTVTDNTSEAILSATDALMREILSRNGLGADDLVSCIFTLTPDLDAQFPAVAARQMGLSNVPLLCAREIPVPGALPQVIRVLMHAYLPDPEAKPQHVYLGDAIKLRLDLQGAQ
jgi:chorismate mutase